MKTQILPLAVAALIATSCAPNKVTTPSISGKWHIAQAYGLATTNAEEEPFIAFEDSGKVYGNASINNFFGSYNQDGTNISLSNIGMTMRLGQSPEIEQAINKALDKASKISVNGDSATIFDAHGKTALVLVRQEQPSLIGDWLIVNAFGYQTSEASDTAFVSFATDGVANGCTGANSFTANYSSDANTISFAEIGSTKMAAGPYRETEQAVFRALESAKSYTIEGQTASVADSTGTVILTLIRK